MSYLFMWTGGQAVNIDLLGVLLKRGCDPNAPTHVPGTTPPVSLPMIEEAIAYAPGFDENRNPDTDAAARMAVKMLLDHGAVFPKTPDDHAQALLKAAALGDLAAMKNAVKHGTSVDAADENGWNALTICLAVGYHDCVKWLLDNKANPGIKTSQGQSPLAFAVMRDEFDLVDQFLAAGVKPSSDLLGHAIRNGDQRMFDNLVKAGANPKEAPLSLCIQFGQVAMAKTVLEAGADPNAPDFAGNRDSVYSAINANQPDILKMLLDHGANPSPKQPNGITPLALALMFGRNDMVSILEPFVKKAEGIASLAANLANTEAKKSFGVEPFAASNGDPVLKDGRWQWHAMAAFGNGDLQADVSFEINHSNPKTNVKQIATEETPAMGR
jgi:ankyrin repeat protein